MWWLLKEPFVVFLTGRLLKEPLVTNKTSFHFFCSSGMSSMRGKMDTLIWSWICPRKPPSRKSKCKSRPWDNPTDKLQLPFSSWRCRYKSTHGPACILALWSCNPDCPGKFSELTMPAWKWGWRRVEISTLCVLYPGSARSCERMT